MTFKISKNEFEDAIAKGLGRAALHVQHHGLEEIDDIVLNACLHNVSYDPQCSDKRAPWLLSMITNSSVYQTYIEKIATTLEKTADDDESHDCEQICDLLADAALQGDLLAAQSLRKKIYQPKNAHYWRKVGYINFINAIIKIDGAKAYIWFAEQLGTAILAYEEEAEAINDILWRADFFLSSYGQENIRMLAFTELNLLANDNVAIATFMKHKQAFNYPVYEKLDSPNPSKKFDQRRERVLKDTNLQKILTGEVRPPRRGSYNECFRFGEVALEEELKVIFEKLIHETDEALCHIWICVFLHTPLPQLHPRIWEMTTSSNEDLRENTLRALAQVKDKSIGEFARKHIQNKNNILPPEYLIQLFELNYIKGDERLILDAIHFETKIFIMHCLVISQIF